MNYPMGAPPRPKSFLHVSFTYNPSIELRVVEQMFSKAADWLRYAPNSWILYTSVSEMIWAQRLRGIPGMEIANIFVCRIDRERSAGYLQQWMWDWINKERDIPRSATPLRED